MASGKLAFPLGSPAAGWDAVYMAHLRSVLVPDENDFSPSNFSAKYTLTGSATLHDRKIVAIWDGEYTIAGGMVHSEALPDAYITFLRESYGEELPVPRKIIYGPVDTAEGKIPCKAGDVIGNLTGNIFSVRLNEEKGFALNAYTYMELLHSKDFFLLDHNFEFPFSRTNVTGDSEIGFTTSQAGQPYFSIKGGSFSNIIYNPGAAIPDQLFSFLSEDQIDIDVFNAGAHPVRIEVHDKTDEIYHTRPDRIYQGAQPTLGFIPQINLKPFHNPFGGDGSRTPGKPLTYAIKIFIDGALLYETKIQQDMKDVIRQEYLFHSVPFQDSVSIMVPRREKIDRNQTKSEFFKPELFYGHNNYKVWLLNARETVKISECMRRHFVDEWLALLDTGTLYIPPEVTTWDLTSESSWRNPERNEAVGGVRNSNHQFGKAIDLKSVHALSLSVPNPIPNADAIPISNLNNVAIHYALFKAGKTWRSEMIELNGPRNCQDVEVLLERGTKLLLSYVHDNNGVISLKIGNKYAPVVGVTPAGGETEHDLIKMAAEYASHVHIGWKHRVETENLSLPEPGTYEGLNVIPALPLKNIIVVAKEAADVPSGSQLPLLHIAATIKNYLDAQPVFIETLIFEAGNPIEFLEAMGAFNPLYRINYFVFMGHAYRHGLILTHMTNLVPDEALEKKILQVFGTKTAFGADDFTEFRVNQFRVSNIRLLPEGMKTNLRAIFRKAAGIFLLGCNSNNDQGAGGITISDELASLLAQSVYGAGYYSKVFEFDDGGWQPVDITRTDPIDHTKKYVLAPNEKGGAQYFKYLYEHGEPENFHPSTAVDLIEFYRESLELSFPDYEFDFSWIENPEDLSTLDTD